MKIKVLMCLELRYGEKMQIYPTHEILSHITYFEHEVAWIVSEDEIKGFRKTNYNDVQVFCVPSQYIDTFLLKVCIKAFCAIRRTRFILKNLDEYKYNIILVRNSILDALLALYIKKKYKIPFVFQIDNPLEQKLEARKIYSNHKYFWSLASKGSTYLVTRILHRADLVVPISKWLGKDLAEKGINRSRILPIPEGVDPNRFSNANGVKIRSKYAFEKDRVVVYVGTLDETRNLNVLIRAFSRIRTSLENVKLLMIGDGTGRLNLEKLTEDIGIKGHVIFTGQIRFKDVPNYIAAADVGVSVVPPLSFYKYSSPIKILEYMALAKPVVANEEIPDHEEIITESRGGVLVKFDENSLAEGIIKIFNETEEGKDMGLRGREWVLKNRSYEVLAKDIEKGYFKLLEQNTN